MVGRKCSFPTTNFSSKSRHEQNTSKGNASHSNFRNDKGGGCDLSLINKPGVGTLTPTTR
eukprot:scaffold2671_cov167-Amphora_coffeaeformis.AAC.12